MTEALNDKMEAVKISEKVEDKKREDYLEWNEYFMAVSFLSAMRSKDPATQVSFFYICNFGLRVVEFLFLTNKGKLFM